MNRWSLLAVGIVFLSFARVFAFEMVPFVIPADVNPDSEIAISSGPLAEQDRLHAEGHFLTENGQRVRLWGVNLSFNANFPTHEDAERIAKRMAAFGVNTVRCHHMDTAKWPRGLWDQSGKELHPEALDRLDYFIDQLAKHGIYTNINLHVGKKHSVDLDIPESPREYDKITGIFTPELVEAQKAYARKLLTHKNKYRNMTYAEDYAVAIVEITNEDSLFMWGAENTLRNLPDFYADILQKQFNGWLKNKYQTQAALQKAWLGDSIPLGENILKNSTFTERLPEDDTWYLEQHEGCRALLAIREYNGKPGLCMEPANHDGTGWHLQYNQRQLTFHKGRIYTVEFEAIAVQPRLITVAVGQAHEPWQILGLSQSVNLTPEWKTYRASFTASADDANGRLNFAFGNDDTLFYLANVKLSSGVEYALDDDESLDSQSIGLFGEVESQQWKIDRMVFLAETEKAYFDGMKSFIKNDLSCKAMVTGTIVFGPLGLYAQSGMDFIDSHAYWQHPRFPNRPWDPGDWLIEQKTMNANPEEATLYRLAAERLVGKPFTVTEYNHPAPLDSQAECVPMIASFAAAQDWDGVWLYTYSHSNENWDREYLNSYFDIDTNPAKWGFMPAGAVMFRDMKLPPFGQIYKGSPLSSEKDPVQMQARAKMHLEVDRDMLQTIGPTMRKLMMQQNVSPPDTCMTWDVGLYYVGNANTLTMTGSTERFDEARRGKIQILTPAFAAVTIVSLDGKPLDSSDKILITVCGRCENTGMKFSADRRTVGRNWGTAPVLIEPVDGTITLSVSGESSMVCKILNPDGTVKEQIPIKNGMIPLKAEYGTMWYLVER